MLKTFVCGSGGFHQHQEEEEDRTWTTHHHHNKKKKKNNKNPYASRGLDTFAAVLADLDEKRRKIYEQLGSPDASLVRFGYSSSRDWVPIVVKLKDQHKINGGNKVKDTDHHKYTHATVIKTQEPSMIKSRAGVGLEANKKKKGFINMWRELQTCLLVVIVLILLCLSISGKPFAIVCTSVWWYLLPKVKQKKNGGEMKKKQYRRWLSDEKMASEVVTRSLSSRSC